MATLEERVSRLEGIAEQVNERLADLQAQTQNQFQALQNQMQAQFQALQAQIQDLQGQMRVLQAGLQSRAEKWEVRLWALAILAVQALIVALVAR